MDSDDEQQASNNSLRALLREASAKAKDAGVVAWIIKPHKDNILLDGIRKVLKL